MFDARGYVLERAEWWLAEVDRAPPEAAPVLQRIGHIVLGHLTRLARPEIALSEGVAARLRPLQGGAAAAELDDAARQLRELSLAVDDETADWDDVAERGIDVFYAVLEGLLLADAFTLEIPGDAAMSLFTAALNDIECFVSAGSYALAFDEAYGPGPDPVRLFCRAVVRIAESVAAPPANWLEEFESTGRMRPMSWYLKQPVRGATLRDAAASLSATLSLEDLSRLLLPVPRWYIPSSPAPLLIEIRPASPLALKINVVDDSDESAGLSLALDGWEVTVPSVDGGEAKATISKGTCQMPLPDAIDPHGFRILFRSPSSDVGIECHGGL